MDTKIFPVDVKNRLKIVVIINNKIIGFNPLVMNLNGTLDVRMTAIKKRVLIAYTSTLLNKNSEIRYVSVQTIFTLGSNLWITLLVG